MPIKSWWGENITATVEHYITISNRNTFDAAKEIAKYGIEILIDLNGHTLHSGLPLMSHRPAPVQMSFLGLPTTSGAPFIDYYIGDIVSLPAEHRDHFTEKLILMPPCYIANDYAQMRGDVLSYTGQARFPRERLNSDEDITKATLLFGTLSNFQKMDPLIFTVWANILRRSSHDIFSGMPKSSLGLPVLVQPSPRFPGSKLLTIEYAGSDSALPNIRNIGLAHGMYEPWTDTTKLPLTVPA